MKQSKLSNVPPSSTVTPVMEGPRYLYFSNPPTTVTLRAADLARAIPEENRATSFDRDRPVEVPCATILSGPAPRVALSDLANLIPECFSNTNFSDVRVALSAKRIALAYHMVARVERLPDPEPEPVPEPEAEQAPEPEPEAEAAQEPVVEIPAAEPAPEKVSEPSETKASEDAKVETPLAETPSGPVAAESVAPKPPFPAVPRPPAGRAASTPDEGPENTASALPKEPAPRRPFSILPIFRRRIKPAEEEPVVEPAVPAPRARVKIPKPRAPEVPIEPQTRVEPEVVAPEPTAEVPEEVPSSPPPVAEEAKKVVSEISEPEPVAVPEPVPEAEIPEPAASPVDVAGEAEEKSNDAVSLYLDTEHVSEKGGRALEQIPHQGGLQAIFMTEEQLDVEQVIERCGDLPGVQSCILSHGNSVLSAHQVPEEIDLVSLSAHAVEMLAAMRTSSAKMGIGAVPAVTVHSEKGPITFFNQKDVCLLVLHKDRGFVPGVREKLQQVVDELSRANLPRALPGGESGPKSLES